MAHRNVVPARFDSVPADHPVLSMRARRVHAQVPVALARLA